MSRFYFEICSIFAWYDSQLPPSHIGSPVQTPDLDPEWKERYQNRKDWKLGTIDEMPNWALVNYLKNLVHTSTRVIENTTWRTKTLSGKTSYYPGETIHSIRHYKNYALDGYGVVKDNNGSPLPYSEARRILLEAINSTINYNREVLLPPQQ
jgi:hypothetical protein